MSRAFWDQIAGAAWSHVDGTNGVMILIFWGVIAFAAVYTYFQVPPPRSFRGLFGHMLPPGTIRHPSARADLLFWLSRRAFMPLLVVPLALSTVTAGHFAYWLLSQLFERPAHEPGPAGPLMLLAFTVTMLIAYDLSYYLYHRLQHRVPFMWELHKVHHSAEVMVGVTKDRVHPVDEIMNRWWDGKLHHSVARQHWHRNFGLTLAIWDRMFGTLIEPEPGEDFLFGLPDGEAEEYQSLARLHFVPLKKIAILAQRRWGADRARLRDSRQLLQTTDQ